MIIAKFCLGALLPAVALICCVPTSDAGPKDEWPQYRGHASQSQTTALPDGTPSFNLLWKQAVAGECHAGIAILGDTVVMPDHGHGKDFVKAFKLSDGSPLWEFSYSNTLQMEFTASPRGTPLLTDDYVYFMNALGHSYCLNLKSGARIWSRTESDTTPSWGYCASPTLSAGKLLLSGSGQAGPIAAYDAKTGTPIWQVATKGTVNYASFLTGSFGGQAQVIGYDATTLGGWNLATGERIWSLDVDSDDDYLCITPVAIDDTLLLMSPSESARLHAFGPDGKLNSASMARSDAAFAETSTPTSFGNLIFASGEALVCLDARDGLKTLWELESDELYGEITVIAARTRLMAICDGYAAVIEYSRSGAHIVKGQRLCKTSYSLPALAHGKLVIRDSHFVYCYDLSNKAQD